MIKSLYIHIPFCHQICTYCDFAKLHANEDIMDKYLDALIQEMSIYRHQFNDLKTIHLGGGTPSSLPLRLLERLLKKLSEWINLSQIEEFGIETNPNDISSSFVSLIDKYHVNRVSMGVESSYDYHLIAMNRSHTVNQVIDAVSLLKKGGFKNINLDFIYAWPNQTFDELKKDIEFAVSLKPTHLSFYALILEPKTKLYHEYKNNHLDLIDEETDALMYEFIRDELPKHGFNQYEISNFAFQGFQSRHNLSYWQVDEYLGIGMGAHSQINERRFHNHSTLKKYIDAVKLSGNGIESEDPCDLLQETFLMGLRLNQGVNVNHFQEKFKINPFVKYPKLLKNIDEKLLVNEDGIIKLTSKGQLLLNYVEQSFI